MYGDSEADLKRSLGKVIEYALAKCNYNKPEAEKLTAQVLSNDRRWDQFTAKDALSKQGIQAYLSGGTVDLNDPRYRNQPMHPLERDQSW
jgi:hypothetical protein